MSTSERDARGHVDRKVSKRLKPLHRLPSSHIPERFKNGEDANEDVTAPSKDAPPQYMHQSIFSMIAAAGSRTDFHARFDESSDSEEDDRAPPEGSPPSQSLPSSGQGQKEGQEKSHKDGREGRSLGSKHLDSLPRRSLSHGKSKNAQLIHLSGQPRAPSPQSSLSKSLHHQFTHPRGAPVLSRMIEAEAQLGSSGLSVEVPEAVIEEISGLQRSNSTPEMLLASRLMKIFGLDSPEKVVSEYPCWLLQSVLLQGYMYITERHICFYAYLPKKSNVVAKSGHLAKRGRQNPKYNRYWFQLKGDVLSYYLNPSDLYFPSGNIDLRYGISASLAGTKDKSKDTKDFSVTTDHRTYHFRADSATSAKEWVKTLRKVIFRSHNDGDSVKISLPVANIIDIEESPVIDFAETFKIRVIDSGESYAIDEYFFSFFSFGTDALETLRNLIDKTSAQPPSHDVNVPSEQELPSHPSLDLSPSSYPSVDPLSKGVTDIREMSPVAISEPVRATLSPISAEAGHPAPYRGSGSRRWSKDTSGHADGLSPRERSRSSFERSGRSESPRVLHGSERTDRSPAHRPELSSESPTHSMIEPTTESSEALQSGTDTQESASQILNRSDVFHSPTVQVLHHSNKASIRDTQRKSGETARSTSKSRLPPFEREPAIHGEPSLRPAVGGHSIAVQDEKHRTASSSAALQDIVKAGAYPIHRAAGLAEYLKARSKKMSSLLASESMGYYEKVYGMWAGARRHYGENEGIVPEDSAIDPEDEEEAVGHGDRFRTHFALPASEKLQATFFGYLHRVLPLYGKVYISNRNFCFRSLLPGTKTKLILPLKDVENVDKEKGFRFGYHGLVIVIRGHEELFFEFNKAESRDDCAVTLLRNLESVKYLVESGLLAQEDKEDAELAKAEHTLLQEARREGRSRHDIELPRGESEGSSRSSESPPVLFDDPRASIIDFKPTESLRITCLTIGSRGDVQPYIALCKGLLAEGHKARIATHAEFEPWVRKHGIDFKPVDGDPAELMRICVENGMFTYSFLKEASVKFRSWIDELLSSAWAACQDSDLLIESPSAMAGIHIAEALGIPYFRAFSMPWTRTRAYPHAFAVPDRKIGGAYNYFSYVMFDNVFWKAIAGQVNRWRTKELGLRSTNLDRMQPNKVPFLYSFSPHVVVPPLDYSDWVRVTGYWFLDEGSQWTPPKELTDFIAKARTDGKKLVYIGFGSIVVSDPAALTKTVVESVIKADVRCILSKGWSDRLGDPGAVKSEILLPPEIHQIKSAPHDWLFKQIDAAAHHGGAGTTGASLRAGLPTIVKPFFGDQYFFGSRVEDLGVGICMKKVNVSVFSRALWEAVNSERMILKARLLGEEIRRENGVETAIQAIYRDLEYAKTLIKKRNILAAGEGATKAQLDDELAAIEENWTFIGDESDSELTKRIRNSRTASLAT